MKLFMRENLSKGNFVEKVFFDRWLEIKKILILDNLRIVNLMDMGYMYGMMDQFIMENIKMVKKMDLVL